MAGENRTSGFYLVFALCYVNDIYPSSPHFFTYSHNISLRKLSSLRGLIFIEKSNLKVKQECHIFYWTSSTSPGSTSMCNIIVNVDHRWANVSVYKLSMMQGFCATQRLIYNCAASASRIPMQWSLPWCRFELVNFCHWKQRGNWCLNQLCSTKSSTSLLYTTYNYLLFSLGIFLH